MERERIHTLISKNPPLSSKNAYIPIPLPLPLPSRDRVPFSSMPAYFLILIGFNSHPLDTIPMSSRETEMRVSRVISKGSVEPEVLLGVWVGRRECSWAE